MKLCLKMLLFMTILTGVFYPLSILIISNIIMPRRSLGSLVYLNDKLVGSKLIGQKFSSDRYFWPRPSDSDYQTFPSKQSYLGPTSKKLKDLIQQRRTFLAQSHQVTDLTKIPIELLCSSSSGIDPHITQAAAFFQIARVMKARGLSESMRNKIEDLILQSAYKPTGKFFGAPLVNVLLLNIALDLLVEKGTSNE